jgi:hypothetical protein
MVSGVNLGAMLSKLVVSYLLLQETMREDQRAESRFMVRNIY